MGCGGSKLKVVVKEKDARINQLLEDATHTRREIDGLRAEIVRLQEDGTKNEQTSAGTDTAEHGDVAGTTDEALASHEGNGETNSSDEAAVVKATVQTLTPATVVPPERDNQKFAALVKERSANFGAPENTPAPDAGTNPGSDTPLTAPPTSGGSVASSVAQPVPLST
eukprot:m.32644 g.32644  ORF g.32644 m.32644 type:complete len:168 (-) comp4906_c0_seq1:195-698(-)